jgi:uncharacterized protein (TIGR01319 family)
MAQLERILATDVGSTTTKAILIERRGPEYRLAARAEAATTVEQPHEDVMIGVQNAIRQLEARTGHRFMEDGELISPCRGGDGSDIYVSSSSAGGGLQMSVAGLIRTMTAESAQRAALGAGALVMDVISLDDARLVVERIRRIKELRPDIILLSGGTDDGQISHVAALSEYIAAANPRPRFGGDYRVPVIFAGNVKAREYVQDTLSENMDVYVVDNIRPTLEREELGPARAEIHRLFLEHVMVRAPGYRRLLEWTKSRIQPTPMAVGKMMALLAKRRGANVIGVDIGGATTDVFSVMDGQFHRTVSANLGMSYSLSNVFVEAGGDNIARWLPYSVPERDLRNWHANKMIRPTTLPQTMDDLILEHAFAREAMRLSVEHHCTLARGLVGVQQERDFGQVFDQSSTGKTLVDLSKTDIIIGGGGVLSNAPRRAQAMLLLIDAFQPRGVCRILVDSIFMMPHLGVLSEVDPEIALEVFEKDCLVSLGTCVAPTGRPRLRGLLARVHMTLDDGTEVLDEIVAGMIKRIPLEAGRTAKVRITPVRDVDMGAGRGRPLTATVGGGVVGVVLDGRGRAIEFPRDEAKRISAISGWLRAMDAYPAGGTGAVPGVAMAREVD